MKFKKMESMTKNQDKENISKQKLSKECKLKILSA